MNALIIFDTDGSVIVILRGDSYYLHSNAKILCEEEGGHSYQFSYIKNAD